MGDLNPTLEAHRHDSLILDATLAKTPVTHGRMYCGIAAGYQIWKIVSDLRIIFFIREHVRTVCNILVTSATDVMCPWGRHEKNQTA